MRLTFYVTYYKIDGYSWKTTQMILVDTMGLEANLFECWSLALAKAERLKPEHSEIKSIEILEEV